VTETNGRLEVARRDLNSDSGPLTVIVYQVPPSSPGRPPGFTYDLVYPDGGVETTVIFEGADSMQALLSCLALAGFLIERKIPGVNMDGYAGSGLPVYGHSESDPRQVAVIRDPDYPPELAERMRHHLTAVPPAPAPETGP
jgi:hypothetical protein